MAGEGGAAGFRYRAFISYAHDDKAWGDWLHRALEAYHVPATLIGTRGDRGVVPARLRPIFRDREELTAAADLSAELEEALQDSATLVVICSPLAAGSHWVNEEILAFKRLGRGDLILPFVVAGEPNADDHALECFPPALKYELGSDGALSDTLAEPVAADARPEGDGRENAKLKLIAGMIGVGFDQVRQREAEAQRRRLRRVLAGVTVLLVVFAGLTAAAVWFAFDAAEQRDAAAAAQAEALAERDRAAKNLEVGIDAARTLVWDLSADVRTSEGVQQRVLLRIQRKAQDLLSRLTEGQDTGTEGQFARVVSLTRSARTLLDLGETADAQADAEAALAGAEALVTLEPTDIDYKDIYVVALLMVTDVRLVTADFPAAQQALEIAQPIADGMAAGSDNDEYRLRPSKIHARFGRLNYARGDTEAALKSYEAAVASDEALVAAEPDNIKFLQQLGSDHINVGDIGLDRDDYAAALKSFSAALAIEDGIVRREPGNMGYVRDLSLGYERVALVKRFQGEFEAALEGFQASLALTERLVASDPGNTEYQRDLAVGNSSIGDVKRDQGDFEGALAHYEISNGLTEKLIAADPDQIDFQTDLMVGYEQVGDTRVLQELPKPALEAYQASTKVGRRIAGRYPGIASFAYWLAQALEKVGGVQATLENRDAARIAYGEALAIQERLVEDEPGERMYAEAVTRLREKLAALPD